MAYDERRGEPRGKKGSAGAGDCVDCKRCLTVCPTGIDIRRGTQLECVQCMACIDACDDVMGKLGRKPGLIRFSTENAIAGQPTRIWRPRVIAYAAGLVGVILAFGLTVIDRQPVELRLTRQPGAPYMALPDGRVQNPMSLRITNKGQEPRAFEIEVVQPADLELVLPTPFVVAPDKVEHVPMFVLRRPGGAEPRVPFTLRVHDDHGFSGEIEGEFMEGAAQKGVAGS